MIRLALFLGLGGLLVYVMFATTQSQAAWECSVCIDYAGRSACRTVRGETRDDALAGAVRNSCAVLSSGVTRGLECDRQPPYNVQCQELR